MGCSITILLEFVDFTGRTKRPVGGLIETVTIVWGYAGKRLIPFPVFSVLSSRLACFSCWGARFLGGGCQQCCWPSYGALTLGVAVYALGD
jgi:hypothetical protein